MSLLSWNSCCYQIHHSVVNIVPESTAFSNDVYFHLASDMCRLCSSLRGQILCGYMLLIVAMAVLLEEFSNASNRHREQALSRTSHKKQSTKTMISMIGRFQRWWSGKFSERAPWSAEYIWLHNFSPQSTCVKQTWAEGKIVVSYSHTILVSGRAGGRR